jgi:hypothetical protein
MYLPYEAGRRWRGGGKDEIRRMNDEWRGSASGGVFPPLGDPGADASDELDNEEEEGQGENAEEDQGEEKEGCHSRT